MTTRWQEHTMSFIWVVFARFARGEGAEVWMGNPSETVAWDHHQKKRVKARELRRREESERGGFMSR